MRLHGDGTKCLFFGTMRHFGALGSYEALARFLKRLNCRTQADPLQSSNDSSYNENEGDKVTTRTLPHHHTSITANYQCRLFFPRRKDNINVIRN